MYLQMEIDEIDIGLISALQIDGRVSCAQLAKSVGISLSTASKRLEALIENRILTIQAIPNPYKIQNDNILICMNVSIDKIDAVYNHLKSIRNVLLVATTFGRYNMVIGIYFKSWNELNHFITREISELDGIYEKEVCFVKNMKKLYHEDFHWRDTTNTPSVIDALDEKIIELLTENGRYSGVCLAGKLGISESLVSKKLARLLDDEVIQIRAQVNPTELGYEFIAFFFLYADHNRIDQICSNLVNCPEVFSVLTLSSGYDINIALITKDIQELNRFIKKNLTPASGIISLTPLITIENHKRYFSDFSITNIHLVRLSCK
jgi:DNA-binding Lrp family transcriptional regulator